MENIILTNNKDLRLVGVKVGVLSTLRFELPLVSASATHVEVIVTSGNVHSAYTATFIDATKRWQCDIAASQFPEVGKQFYEVAYELDGKQFWDGKGWIEIENATTSGIEPQPRPEPYRYAVVSVNGYGADAEGAVRIPKTFISANSPVTTEGYIEGDICFNRETGAMWTLCNVQGTPTWVFAYKNYYTKAETDEAIDRVAAYYITYDAAGNPFPTYASLANAQTVYSGGSVRVPTRNDYCVVLADETHDNAEYRYIYAVAEGEAMGSWQPQFPVEGVMTVDQTVTKNSTNPVSGGGIWSAIWGVLSALPTGFSSLYDWCVAQLAGKASTADAMLTERGFSEWTISPAISNPVSAECLAAFQAMYPDVTSGVLSISAGGAICIGGQAATVTQDISADGTTLSFNGHGWANLDTYLGISVGDTVATRAALQGYQLGSQTDKPLASEAEAEALRTGKQDALTFDNAPVSGSNNPVKSGGVWSAMWGERTTIPYSFTSIYDWAKGCFASPLAIAPKFRLDETYAVGDVRIEVDVVDGSGLLYRCKKSYWAGDVDYPSADSEHWEEIDVNTLLAGKADRVVSPTTGNLAALDANGNPTDAGWTAGELARYSLITKTINNGAVTLDDRAINAVAVSSSLASLTVNFPTATSGKARDFGLRLTVASGVTTAPELALPQGVVCENADGEAPEIGADGAATILYFTETASGVFLVKGEVVTAIS